MTEIITRVGMFLIPFLFALCAHEYAHGWVANKLGDPTARLMGRLTLNPMAHADILGTFILPILAITTGAPFFGWAKPVPVNSRNLKMNERVGMFWVSLAGPGSNVIMAVVAALVFGVTLRFFETAVFAHAVTEFSKVFIMINLSLAFFNLIPVYPLDGAKIFGIFFPDSFNRKMEELAPVASIVLIVLFMTGGLATFLYRPVILGTQLLLRTSLHLVGVAL